MIQESGILPSSRMGSKETVQVAIGLALLFLFLLGLLHFLEPEFDPSWRMISEYALGRYGWLMMLAFFCWGGSVLALLLALWPSLQARAGLIGRGWLLVIAVALFGAGLFKTNPITDPTPGTANTIHSLCGAMVILTFPMAASFVAGSLTPQPAWASVRRGLRWGTLLVWLSLFAFFGSILVSRAINPSAGRVGPEVFLGWPNRGMVVIYVGWLIGVALHALRVSRQNVAEAP